MGHLSGRRLLLTNSRNHRTIIIIDSNESYLNTTNSIQSFAAKLPNSNYIISYPAGQGISTEQYAIFYNNEVVLLSTTDYTEKKQDSFERPPLEATFKVKNWTFTLYTIHIKVTNVPQELTNLKNLIDTPAKDTILLGDLNAD